MLGGLLDGITGLVVSALNALIAALGSAIAAVVAILPDMPDPPDMPDAFLTAGAWVAWFWPVEATLDVLAFILTVWLVWQIAAIALRWAKAI